MNHTRPTPHTSPNFKYNWFCDEIMDRSEFPNGGGGGGSPWEYAFWTRSGLGECMHILHAFFTQNKNIESRETKNVKSRGINFWLDIFSETSIHPLPHLSGNPEWSPKKYIKFSIYLKINTLRHICTENFSVGQYDQFGQKGYVFWRVSQKG